MQRLVLAVVIIAVFPVAREVPAAVTVGALAGLYAVLITYEAIRFAEARDRIRHASAHH